MFIHQSPRHLSSIPLVKRIHIVHGEAFGDLGELGGYLEPLGELCAVGEVAIADESADNPAHWLWAHDEAGNTFTLHRDVHRVGTDIAVGPHAALRGWQMPPRIEIPTKAPADPRPKGGAEEPGALPIDLPHTRREKRLGDVSPPKGPGFTASLIE